MTPVAAPGLELPRSKGKGPELALESEGVQESQRCDSCERQNAECIHVKVSRTNLRFVTVVTPSQLGTPVTLVMSPDFTYYSGSSS